MWEVVPPGADYRLRSEPVVLHGKYDMGLREKAWVSDAFCSHPILPSTFLPPLLSGLFFIPTFRNSYQLTLP